MFNWGNGWRGHPKCIQVRTGRKGFHASCVCTHLHYLISCFCLMVSCGICRNLILPSFKKGVFVRHGAISVVMKQAFFILSCLTERKLAEKLLILIK